MQFQEMTPSNWFFILLALLFCSYVKLTSGKPQSPLQSASASVISALK